MGCRCLPPPSTRTPTRARVACSVSLSRNSSRRSSGLAGLCFKAPAGLSRNRYRRVSSSTTGYLLNGKKEARITQGRRTGTWLGNQGGGVYLTGSKSQGTEDTVSWRTTACSRTPGGPSNLGVGWKIPSDLLTNEPGHPRAYKQI